MKRSLLLIGLLALLIKPISAAQSTIVESEGSACMGEDKSRKQTEQVALIDAKKKAVELASTHIHSETDVKNFALEKDLLSAYANADVKVVKVLNQTWYKDASYGDCYRIKIQAEIIPTTRSINTTSSDTDRKLAYDLQEHCSKQAQSFVDNFQMGNQQYNFNSHYSSRLNKCFVLIELFIDDSDKDIYQVYLYDAIEKKPYGKYAWKFPANSMPLICEILNTRCKTKDEFDDFVKKYMDE